MRTGVRWAGARVTHPRRGFKSFAAAQQTLSGMELMHRLHKGQMDARVGPSLTAAEQFYALATSSLPLSGLTHPHIECTQ